MLASEMAMAFQEEGFYTAEVRKDAYDIMFTFYSKCCIALLTVPLFIQMA